MNLYDLKTPLSKMKREDVVLFIKELRYQRTLDHSPPVKEKKEKKSKKNKNLLLDLTEEQMVLFMELLQKEKEKC